MPILDGISYQIAQTCLDIRAQMKKHGIQNLGIEGDLRHQAGCGDHVPWECTGHYGWIMAIDVGWGPIRPGKIRFTPARLRQYLLPRLRARKAEFGWVKYIITGNVLNDTRSPWNLKDQWGPDGTDHIHISVDNDNKTTHTTLIDDCMAWLDAGMPDPVTFVPGQTSGVIEMRSVVAACQLETGEDIAAVLGSDFKIYLSVNGGGFRAVNTAPQRFDPGLSMCPDGEGGVVICAIDSHKMIFPVRVRDVLHADTLRAVVVPPAPIPGPAGAEGAPGVSRTADGKFRMTLVGTNAADAADGLLAHSIYRAVSTGVDENGVIHWGGFSPLPGSAGAV